MEEFLLSLVQLTGMFLYLKNSDYVSLHSVESLFRLFLYFIVIFDVVLLHCRDLIASWRTKYIVTDCSPTVDLAVAMTAKSSAWKPLQWSGHLMLIFIETIGGEFHSLRK